MPDVNVTVGEAGRFGQSSSANVAFAKPRAKHQFTSSASNTAVTVTAHAQEIVTVQVEGGGTVKVAVEENPAASAPDATSAWDWYAGGESGTLWLQARVDGTRFAITDA